MNFNSSIDSKTTIGHVHLKVSDLERSVLFYTDVLGFEVMQRMGKSAAFLSAGGYHHHIGLNTWESADGQAPLPGTTGLYHFAILVANRKELARAIIDLLLTNRNDKSPDIVDAGGWRFVIGKGKVNKAFGRA